MKYGLLGDIHGNLEALDAVLAALARRGVGAWICVGDIVGYGADPHLCIERVRALPNLLAVAGNHDWAVIGRIQLFQFNPTAHAALLWTRERLPAEDREFLARLPLVVETDRLTVVHGSLDEPALFEYIQTPAQALRTMRRLHTPVGFLGHSHVSGFFRFDGRRIDILSGDAERVDPAARLLVNIGSVGQPRDDDARASFGVYDDASGLVELFREPYDIAMAARKIQEAGLPPLLAERLGFGR
ncbi:MAG: metallophosphoesterase family protein [Planctomycetota bacterium]